MTGVSPWSEAGCSCLLRWDDVHKHGAGPSAVPARWPRGVRVLCGLPPNWAQSILIQLLYFNACVSWSHSGSFLLYFKKEKIPA